MTTENTGSHLTIQHLLTLQWSPLQQLKQLMGMIDSLISNFQPLHKHLLIVNKQCLKSTNGGEQEIRTLDTLPYTHFPGVRLRPLGQLST